MAKQITFDDFNVDDDEFEVNSGSEEEEEELKGEEGEEETEKKTKVKAKTKTKVKDEDEEEEEESEEEEDKSKTKSKKKKVSTEEEEEEESNSEEEEKEEEEGEEPDETEEAELFFEQVEKITGQGVEVDYGDVNPLSPQGVALREKAVRQDALEGFLTELEEKFPDVHRALTHAYNGGNVADLFTQTTGRDYSNVEIKDGDDALAKEILKEYYKARGVKNEAKINKLIETDEETGLIKEAQSALKELKEEQEAEKQRLIEAQAERDQEQRKKDKIILTAIDEAIESRTLGNFKVLDKTEARSFKEFVVSSVRRGKEGKYDFVTTLDPQNLNKQLQYLYFQFKKGDLSKIIQQKASTQRAEALSLKLKAEQAKTKKTTVGDSGSKLSMSDFIV